MAGGLLVRVGIDQGFKDCANAPYDPKSREFLYVPIHERPEMKHKYRIRRTYDEIENCAPFEKLGYRSIKKLIDNKHVMHLDPDFEHLTYGDQGQRAKQIVSADPEFLAFYASFRATRNEPLCYGLIGIMYVDEIVDAMDVSKSRWDENAHTRRKPVQGEIIVRAMRKVSGRFTKVLPIGEYRDRAYRVTHDILDEWGGLSVKNGYLQRSARLPRFQVPERFKRWLDAQNVTLMRDNN